MVMSVALLTGYLSSYWVVREFNTVRHERDGCPVRGCEEVRFPGDGVYMIYVPIYLLDKYTDGDAEFVPVRHD